MVNRVKKTSEEIKESILSQLENEPKTVADIAESIKSNWATTEKFLKELSGENKVRELISTEKKKMYQKNFGDTYFDIPISNEEREKFRALFSLILKKYKEMGLIPNKTQFAKTAVKVIRSKEAGLELPTAWYFYGVIPLMIADPSLEYKKERKLEKERKINEITEMYIKKIHIKKSKEIQKEQHIEYDDKLYQIADEFLDFMEESDWDQKDLFKIINKFYIECPVDKDFENVFSYTDRFVSIVRKLSYFEDPDNHKKEIRSTFDSLWKFIATYKFYISVRDRFPNKEMLDLYLGNAILFRKQSAQEAISDLYSIYLSKLDGRGIKVSSEVQKIKDIMGDWTGE